MQQPAYTCTVVESHHYGILVEQLFPCKAQWKRIAGGLRFHNYEIDGIKADHMIMLRGNEGCLEELLSRWINWAAGDARGSQDRATLEALKTVVRNAGFPNVAYALILSERRHGGVDT